MSLKAIAAMALVFGFAGLCAAQGSSAEQNTGSITSQRQQLTAEREEAIRRFDEQDAQCKIQFAVTGCLKDVNRSRLARLSEIRKAQTRLDDMDRLERGREQRQQLEDKAAEHQRQLREVSPPLNVVPKIKKPIGNGRSESQTQGRIGSTESKAATGAVLSTTQQSENRLAYEAKQLQAERKRLERDKRIREKDPAVQGLPQSP